MTFLKTADELRAVEWGRTYLWDLKFRKYEGNPKSISPPGKFINWFPAETVTENLAALDMAEFAGFLGADYNIPKSSSSFGISITFLDDINHSLSTWIANWINKEIMNGGDYVSTISESVKWVDIAKLNQDRSLQTMNSYLVMPKGEINFEGTSESDVPRYTMEFVAAFGPSTSASN